MGLNESQGNMYEFVTHTWNAIKGECYHDCTYCYMKRRGRLKPTRLDERELKTDLGAGNFIFVGSSCDMWAENIPDEWIDRTLSHCSCYENHYLFQTKNPLKISRELPQYSSVCITLESNRHYPSFMQNSPAPYQRVEPMRLITFPRYITIEPVMDFDLDVFVEMLKSCEPIQVNIGADSGRNNLPEPSSEKVQRLIHEIGKFSKVHRKSNLTRLVTFDR